jgi:Protein of unknown function (DUF2939)
MKRLITLLFLAVIGFYVVWPAWSGYRIAAALSAQDAAALEGKIDFPAVRESLRPVVTTEIGKRVDKEMASLGPVGQTLGGDVKKQMQAKLVDQALTMLITPANVIRIAHEGGDIAGAVEKILGEAAGQMGAVVGSSGAGSGAVPAIPGGLGGVLGQVMGSGAAGAAGTGDLGGLLGKALGGAKKQDAAPATTDAKAAPAAKRSFGMGNIKNFGFAGPLGFDVSVARDAAAPKADATIGMAFTGGDWKLTRVVPNL